MDDGAIKAISGPTHNERMDLGAQSCLCASFCRVHELLCTLHECTVACFVGMFRCCHSPLLDQQDGDQYQQYKDQNTSTEPSYLHHSIRLFSRIRDDFWFLCCTFATMTNTKIINVVYCILA